MKRARKIIIAALLLYWPGIFVLTHLPQLPAWALNTQISDKTAHFLAYIGLTFLWWFAFNPEKRVNWLRPFPWITLAVMGVYAFLDEWLQGFVGRNPDFYDFCANMAGVIAAMALLTIFRFWSASLILSAFILFGATNLIRINIVRLMPFSSAIFYLFGYALVAFCWVMRLEDIQTENWKKFIAVVSLPLVVLAAVHLYAGLSGRGFHSVPIIVGLLGITTVIIAWFTSEALRRRHTLSQ